MLEAAGNARRLQVVEEATGETGDLRRVRAEGTVVDAVAGVRLAQVDDRGEVDVEPQAAQRGGGRLREGTDRGLARAHQLDGARRLADPRLETTDPPPFLVQGHQRWTRSEPRVWRISSAVWAGDSRLRPKRMIPAGPTARNREAVSPSSSGPGRPTIRQPDASCSNRPSV